MMTQLPLTETRRLTAFDKRMESGAKVLDWPNKGFRATLDHRRSNAGMLELGSSLSRCFCSGCGHGFNSVAAFDMHQPAPVMAKARATIERFGVRMEATDETR